MKKVFVLFCISVAAFIPLMAQQLCSPDMPRERLDINTSLSEKQRLAALKKFPGLKDAGKYLLLKQMIVQPDSAKTCVELFVGDDNAMMIYDTFNKKLYRWRSNSQEEFNPWHSNLLDLLRTFTYDEFTYDGSIVCIYLIRLNPSRKDEYLYIKTDDGTAAFFNNDIYGFRSMQEVLDYEFGSPKNFIDAYEKRVEYFKRQRAEYSKRRGFNMK